jgi:hypothetical protein
MSAGSKLRARFDLVPVARAGSVAGGVTGRFGGATG